ncbi:Voltage-dependent L-type calcium channel subunit alpha-1D (CHCACHA1D) (Voltage-gated calcium channel subunit alpha Cav1.3) [Durusdinium trenchii]|uniref:Voltage-dependent L-type calcium channel subunit alpha-1D (CHCACHA1D) (Voltage-gated calcium channel subunit alpha Cav1.3) n=1 Tax=Durusdinium trenchii TaxID=1381693 RepID=A0ABP0PMZ9_9DINO
MEFEESKTSSASRSSEETHKSKMSKKCSFDVSDDGNRTIEMYRVESFESGAPAVTNLSIISSNAEHEEQVERPNPSKVAAPGSSLKGATDFQGLRELMQSYHEDLMSRFDQQQELISRLCKDQSRSTNSSRTSRHSAASSTSTVRERRTSVKSSTTSTPSPQRERPVSSAMSIGLPVRASMAHAGSPHPSPKAKAKLFSSLTRVDEELRQKAADVDAEQAKANRRQRDESEDVGQNFFQRLVSHVAFDLFFAVAILVNAIFIGVEVQAQLLNSDQAVLTSVHVIGKTFTVIFLIELILRMLAQGRHFCSTTNEDWRWNLLDTIIVLASLWDVGLEIVTLAQGADSEGLTGMSGLRTLRIIRITRLVKIARLARILRFIMALRTLTQSILHTLKSLIWAMILLALIVYTFAVLFTQVVHDLTSVELESVTSEEERAYLEQVQIYAKQYFSTLPQAMLTLYMSIANGVSWEQVLVPLHAVHWIWECVFVFYIAFATLAVLNVITGVFCQSAIDSAQSDHEMVIQSILNNKDAHIEKIRMLFSEIDEDSSGVITYQMFERGIRSEEVKTYFESIDLDVWDVWTFFKLLDMDSGGAVEIEEFLMGCLRLRGNAKAMDIAKLCHDQSWLIREQARFWEFVENELNDMHMMVARRLP